MSWIATILLTLTTPVSMSTDTSANWQPPTPTLESPASNLPVSEIGIIPSLRQASFHDITGSPVDPDLPVLQRQVFGLVVWSGDAIRLNSSSRAWLTAV